MDNSTQQKPLPIISHGCQKITWSTLLFLSQTTTTEEDQLVLCFFLPIFVKTPGLLSAEDWPVCIQTDGAVLSGAALRNVMAR